MTKINILNGFLAAALALTPGCGGKSGTGGDNSWVSSQIAIVTGAGSSSTTSGTKALEAEGLGNGLMDLGRELVAPGTTSLTLSDGTSFTFSNGDKSVLSANYFQVPLTQISAGPGAISVISIIDNNGNSYSGTCALTNGGSTDGSQACSLSFGSYSLALADGFTWDASGAVATLYAYGTTAGGSGTITSGSGFGTTGIRLTLTPDNTAVVVTGTYDTGFGELLLSIVDNTGDVAQDVIALDANGNPLGQPALVTKGQADLTGLDSSLASLVIQYADQSVSVQVTITENLGAAPAQDPEMADGA